MLYISIAYNWKLILQPKPDTVQQRITSVICQAVPSSNKASAKYSLNQYMVLFR